MTTLQCIHRRWAHSEKKLDRLVLCLSSFGMSAVVAATAATRGTAGAVATRPSLAIREGDTVIICINGESRTIQKVTSQGYDVLLLSTTVGVELGPAFSPMF